MPNGQHTFAKYHGVTKLSDISTDKILDQLVQGPTPKWKDAYGMTARAGSHAHWSHAEDNLGNRVTSLIDEWLRVP